MEDFIIKETDKSEVSIYNPNNLFVIVSETGSNQPIRLYKNKMNKTKINKGDQTRCLKN